MIGKILMAATLALGLGMVSGCEQEPTPPTTTPPTPNLTAPQGGSSVHGVVAETVKTSAGELIKELNAAIGAKSFDTADQIVAKIEAMKDKLSAQEAMAFEAAKKALAAAKTHR